MKRYVLLTALMPFLMLVQADVASGNGLLIPSEPDLPALAMLNHHVNITIEDQVAVTRIQQTFRNHTDRRLEATYVFPVPEGASVSEFAMWINGQRVKGELLTADKAKSIYTSIVRQTKNPALLDHIGSDMLSLKVFPIPAGGDQKIEVSFTSIAKKEHELVEYVYPLESDRASASTLEEFRLELKLKSRQPIGNIYSPTHDIAINQTSDHEATIEFQQQGARLDRDFQLFYANSGEDIGLTALDHRPISDEYGYVMFLVSPRAELSKKQTVPRDIVFVIDSSGSMAMDDKMKQAKNALRQCLDGLAPDDRFALVSFASTVNRYRDQLVPATEEYIKAGKGWVADQYAGGGTAIHAALATALDMRSDNPERMFTVAFFTDGQPTIGETNTDTILADIRKKNSANTRIFSFGLGDDLNAVFLDQIAEQTRAVSSYVRPKQDIEAKVSSFFAKIHHPVLANLKLSTTADLQLSEVYPPQLPDLFHGDQLVVLARYQGVGHATVVLNGTVGPHEKTFDYAVNFEASTDGKPFVEELWARRKVGYLLDQIRINGEQSELVEAVVVLAKQYGITTPYTSYLIMPDAPVELAASGRDLGGGGGRMVIGAAPAALAPKKDGERRQRKLAEVAKEIQRHAGDLAGNRGRFQDEAFDKIEAMAQSRPSDDGSEDRKSTANIQARQKFSEAKNLKSTLDLARGNYQSGQYRWNQINKLGVDLSLCTNNLKCQSKLEATAICNVANRNCMEFGGVWIDEDFSANTKTLAVKAQSDAYFRILERQPQMKDVFRLGNHVVWIAPNGMGLVIDTTDGNEQMSDNEIDSLFASR